MTQPDRLPPRPGPEELAYAARFKATASNGSQAASRWPTWNWTVVRDSKDIGGPVHCYTPREWSCFLDGARCGEFDRPE